VTSVTDIAGVVCVDGVAGAGAAVFVGFAGSMY
jgi:hypothetical protein